MSKAKFASLLLGALLAAAPGLALLAETATPQSVGLSSERLQRVHELVDRTIAAGEISGAVTLVARNGQVAYLEAQGVMDLATKKPMQPDSMFRMASMSKPVAAVAILMLAEEGKVRLSDPVSRFIPADANLGRVGRRGKRVGGKFPVWIGDQRIADAVNLHTRFGLLRQVIGSKRVVLAL